MGELSKSELKPCPFCGGEAAWFSYPNGEYEVKCRNPMCLSKSGRWDTMAEARTAWNRRIERGCRKVRVWEDSPHGGGGYVYVCSECDELLAQDGEGGEFDGPNYCPGCGAKVVNEWKS